LALKTLKIFSLCNYCLFIIWFFVIINKELNTKIKDFFANIIIGRIKMEEYQSEAGLEEELLKTLIGSLKYEFIEIHTVDELNANLRKTN
jgi:hypothetical protein